MSKSQWEQLPENFRETVIFLFAQQGLDFEKICVIISIKILRISFALSFLNVPLSSSCNGTHRFFFLITIYPQYHQNRTVAKAAVLFLYVEHKP